MNFFLKNLLTLILTLNISYLFTQEVDFHSPIETPFNLSGTFDEFRSNFHTGIDFKGGKGKEIYSIEDGYISRIETNIYGYGKVVYINHYNGYTSVYAHLNNFSPILNDYIKGEQYKSKSYTIKRFPKVDEIKVSKGELIGYSGNTGRSFGAHLHFEIRDTKTQNALNPLNFNYEYIDNERPIIRGLYVIDEEDKLSFSLPEQVKISKLNDSVYIGNDIIYNGSIGFGIDIYDIQYKNLFNRNGIYEIELLIDSLPLFSYKMDEINFSENHFKKLMYDYKSLVENNKRVLKVFTPPNSDLSFLKNNSFNGIIDPREVKESFVTIKVSDRNRNSSYLNFNINYKDTIKKKLAYDGIEILKNQKYEIIKNESIIEINKNTFYEDVLMNISEINDTIFLGDDRFPIRSSIIIKYPISKLKDTSRLNQIYIGKVFKNEVNYIKSKIDKKYIYTSTSNLGNYTISRDSIFPEIRPLNFSDKSNVSSNKSLRLYIKDDKSGIKNYEAFINGKWALFEYEPKQNLIFHDLDDSIIESGENDLLIEFEDGVGNKQVYSSKIYY